VDWQTPALTHALDRWLDEDLGRGDLTAAALQDRQGEAHWIVKQNGCFCGGPLVKRLFQRLDPEVQVQLLVGEGAAVRTVIECWSWLVRRRPWWPASAQP
tara:strand:- start:1296 stop:1595 length:300 start_codon:yes stop_codon:yes gene_type:complete